MNDKRVRSEIIKYYIDLSSKKNIKWLGTWTISLDDDCRLMDPIQQLKSQDSVKNLIHKNKNSFIESTCLFTVNIVYEINKVHYVSFIYNPDDKILISFDPGVQLYHHGQKTIIPFIRKTFNESGLIASRQFLREHNLGTCHDYSFCGKKWGIQYNGRNESSLPADSFCQTWTIYFFIRYLIETDFEYVKNWCRVAPKKREFIITSFFLIPNILKFKSLQIVYMKYLENKYSLSEIMSVLYNFAETCQFTMTHETKCKQKK
jgi:hypothetical protein